MGGRGRPGLGKQHPRREPQGELSATAVTGRGRLLAAAAVVARRTRHADVEMVVVAEHRANFA